MVRGLLRGGGIPQSLKRVLRSRVGDILLRMPEETPLSRFILNAVYDPKTGISIGGGDMEADWDERARRNSRFFIAVDDAESEATFLESGERDLKNVILNGIPLHSESVVLEIGCGVGRLLRPLSALVREVHGVDISKEMVRRGADALGDCPNVHLHHTAGDLRMFRDAYFEFCFSYRVFQHIPRREAILRYLQEVRRVLSPGGLFRFQVCMTDTEGRRQKGGGTWFGVLFTQGEIRNMLSNCGFEILSMEREPSPARQKLWDYFLVTCRRTGG